MSHWEELQERSIGVIESLLANENPSTRDIAKAKIATSALASTVRHEATESSKERTAVITARMLTQDEDSFRRYLSVTAPRLAPGQLTAGSHEA